MLSRLAKQTVLGQRKFPLLIYRSSASSGSDAEVSTESHAIPTEIDLYPAIINRIEEVVETKDISKAVATKVTDHVPRPTPFDGPLRDYVNFPKVTRLLNPSPTRLGFIPEEWFRFLYPKIGVTGPYTLGIGLSLFLMSKEIWLVSDYEFQHFIAFTMWMYIIIKTPIGEKLREVAYDRKEADEQFDKLRKYNEEFRLEAMKHEKEEQWRAEGKHLLLDAKKENVGLQLEASYRESVMDLYQQIKKRLDYQVEITKIDSRIKQQFMVNWVIDRVKESLSQASEKDNLKQCITNLNVLASKV